MPPIAILLLEDSPLDAELIGARLSKGGIDYAMRRVETRGEFLAALRAGPIDLILADYSLPSFDGLAALELARHECPDTPFLFVSGGLGEEVAIDSLKRGATDYVLKQKLDRLAPAVTRAITEARERAERRRTEAALRESERRHRLILESVEDYAILLLDPEGRVCGWNRGAERILGLPESEALGSPVARIFAPEDAHAGRPEAELRRAAALGRSEDERWYVRHGGERFWGGGVVRPLSDETGRLRGFVKVVHDMTERRRVEEALREADRRKDEFLAMLAHELRNPLSAIGNAIQLVRRSSRDEHLEWAKEVIDQQAGHLARMIDDLLDVSRITRGKIQLRLERQDLAPILQRAAESVRPLIEARRHELTVTLAPGPLGVEADATRLEQILTNLLTNAAKYTDEGGHIVLAARCEGHEHVITVGDDGVGIAPEMLPRVFEPFTQAEQTIDRSQGGLGIGLTLARHLAEMHGGGIAAASPGRGRGSEFTVRLPAVREPAAAPPPPRVEVPWAWAPAGARILLVDDNVQSAQGLASLLELAGYAVRSAFDGEDALVAARLHRPDVVLLDIGLPGMDGYQVAAQLRQDHDTRDALLIAITGYGHPEAVQRAHAAGFDHHLVKPLDLDALLGLIAAADRPAHSPYPLTG